MSRLIRWLTNTSRRSVVLGDYALVASVLILGSVVGLVLVRNALLGGVDVEEDTPPPACSSCLFPEEAP